MHLVHVTSNALNTTRHPDLAKFVIFSYGISHQHFSLQIATSNFIVIHVFVVILISLRNLIMLHKIGNISLILVGYHF